MNVSNEQDKDTIKKFIQTNIFTIPDSIIPVDKRLYYPDWTNKPPKEKTVITAQGTDLLRTGGQLCIASKPGVGKSSICEGIIAKYINPDCEGLGFDVELSANRNKILYIDTERSPFETWESWERTMTRAKVFKPEMDKRVIFGNFKSVELSKRKEHVVQLLNNNSDIGLILFDGAGDFVINTNDIAESSGFIDWINTFNPNINLIFTIHTNPQSNKPRGHLGSELCRRANSVLLAQKLEDEVVEITSSFSEGKVRHGRAVSWYYKYDDEKEMFMLTSYTPKPIIDIEKDRRWLEIAESIWTNGQIYSFSHVISRIVDATAKTEEASKQIFWRHFKEKLCKEAAEGGWERKGT